MSVAEVIWKTLVAITLLIWLLGLAVDFCLWLYGLPTMSQWLRQNPGWYCWPALTILILITLLGLHLFFNK